MPDDASSARPLVAAADGPGWWRMPFRVLSPPGSRGRLAILIFHRVHASPDPLFPAEMDAATFRTRLTWLREWFNVLPLEEAVDGLSRGELPARALSITFDDGYADNVAVALPILRELGLTATFFIATGFLDGGRMWNDTVIEAVRRAPGDTLDLASMGLGTFDTSTVASRRSAIDALVTRLKYLPPEARQAKVEEAASHAAVELPEGLMMTSADVRHLAASGMGVGAHTVSHPILARIDAGAARREISQSRETLEELLGRRVKLFAYPNGKPGRDYRARDVELVRSLGFTAAVSTAPGAARHGDSMYELPRFTPWDRTRSRWGARLARNYLSSVDRAVA